MSTALSSLLVDARRRATRWPLSAAVPLLILILGLIAYHAIYTRYRVDSPIHGDGEGYYAYLPAYLVHFDPSFNRLVQQHLIPAYAALGHQPPSAFGLSLQSTGNWLDKYGVGEALLLLPFFVVGHALALAKGSIAKGYSGPETLFAGLAALAYTAAGLWLLRALLKRWFPDWAIAVTLLAITLGTSLFSFATWDPLVAHAFSFFIVALLLLLTVRWYEAPQSWGRAVPIGVAAGLLIDVRLTDVVLLAALPLLGIGTVAQMRQRLWLLWQQRLKVAAMLGCLVAVFAPQAITWHIATGHWLIRPYPGENFDFLHPHLIESLVSFRPHGLLPYAPVLLLAFAGLVLAWFRRRDIALPVTVAFLPFWYLVAAWYDWSFADGFGQRAFIDVLPLLALPLTFLYASLHTRLWRTTTVAVSGVMVAVTCALMVAYWQYRIPGDGIDGHGYVSILAHPGQLLAPPDIPSWLRPLAPRH